MVDGRGGEGAIRRGGGGSEADGAEAKSETREARRDCYQYVRLPGF